MTDGRANRPRRRRLADRRSLGAMLATVRTDGGVTQQALAEACGVGLRTVQRWESGEARPSVTDMMIIMRVCDCSWGDVVPSEAG